MIKKIAKKKNITPQEGFKGNLCNTCTGSMNWLVPFWNIPVVRKIFTTD